ncbi:MAG: hypothetical protein ABI855_16050 [Bacteroidota bacterium]
MNEIENRIDLLNKLIAAREEHFQHALCESAEQTLIAHLKNDIDFLKEKRKQLLQEMILAENKILN